SVSAKEHAFVQVQRVVQVHGRVFGREVEGGEVVPLGFSLWSDSHREAEFAEDLANLIYHERYRVQSAAPAFARRHGVVDCQCGGARRGAILVGGYRGIEVALEGVEGSPGLTTRLRWYGCDGALKIVQTQAPILEVALKCVRSQARLDCVESFAELLLQGGGLRQVFVEQHDGYWIPDISSIGRVPSGVVVPGYVNRRQRDVGSHCRRSLT